MSVDRVSDRSEQPKADRFKATALILNIQAKNLESRQALVVAGGLAHPAFHACPLAQGQGLRGHQPVTGRSWCGSPACRAKQTPVCGGARLCSCLSLKGLTFLAFSRGPRKPAWVLCVPGVSGLPCSPDKGCRPGRAGNDGSLQLIL